MPRSIWNGTVKFGLISVPVKVHSATEDHAVHFHQLHARDGARIHQKRICTRDGQEVEYRDVVKGYEVAEGEYVVLSQEEIAAAAGDGAHVIELEQFVCTADIDPMFFGRSYYLGAGQDAEEAYRLLHDGLESARRAGIGRWVFHNREYLVAVRPLDGLLALHTLRFADELVDAGELELPEPSRPPNEREVEMAGALVESLAGKFDPAAYEDTVRERILELIERKAKGASIELPAAPAQEAGTDLLAALEASLQASGGSRRPAPAGARGS